MPTAAPLVTAAVADTVLRNALHHVYGQGDATRTAEMAAYVLRALEESGLVVVPVDASAHTREIAGLRATLKGGCPECSATSWCEKGDLRRAVAAAEGRAAAAEARAEVLAAALRGALRWAPPHLAATINETLTA